MFSSKFIFLPFLIGFLFATDPTGLRLDIKRVETLMERAFEVSRIAQVKKTDELILFLGNTQIGKSTIINYLLGCEYKKKGTKVMLADHSIPEFTKSGLGACSTTLYPEIHYNQECPFRFCDTQGFGDTRGEEEVIVSSLLLEMSINAANSVKIVIPFSETQLEDAGKGIRDFCKTIDKLMKNKVEVNILFLYNRKNRDWSIESVYERINELLEEEKNRLQQLGEAAGGSSSTIKKIIKKIFSYASTVRDEPDPDEEKLLESASVSNQIDKISSLWLLQKMRREKDKILFVDIFLPGQGGRQEVYDALRILPVLQKQRFNFGKLSGCRPIFDAKMSVFINQLTQMIEIKKEFEQFDAYTLVRYENLEDYFSYQLYSEEQLQKMINEGTSLPETEKTVWILENTMDKKRDEITMFRHKIKKNEENIADYERKINVLNTEDLELHKTFSWKEECSLFYWYRGYLLEYKDLPFDHRTKNLGADTTESTNIDEKGKGQFTASYVSNWFKTCSGNVNFYIQRKKLETSKVQIQNYRDKIKIEQIQNMTFQNSVRRLEDEITRHKEESVHQMEQGKQQIERKLEEIQLKKREINEIIEKIKKFQVLKKNVILKYQEQEKRIQTWNAICLNLQNTTERSIYESTFKIFLESYDKKFEQIASEIECAITLVGSDLFLQLPCGHHFSQEGIEGLYESRRDRPTSIPCPTCRQPFNRGQHINSELCKIQFNDIKDLYLDTIERCIARAEQFFNA